MNKNELIEKVAASTNLTKKQAAEAVTATIDAISGALKECETVSLIGFGTFAVKTRAARQGRNPKTKETIEIPASKAVTFKVGKALKEAVK